MKPPDDEIPDLLAGRPDFEGEERTSQKPPSSPFPEEFALELDYGSLEKTDASPDAVDEMEFDPLSMRPAPPIHPGPVVARSPLPSQPPPSPRGMHPSSYPPSARQMERIVPALDLPTIQEATHPVSRSEDLSLGQRTDEIPELQLAQRESSSPRPSSPPSAFAPSAAVSQATFHRMTGESEVDVGLDDWDFGAEPRAVQLDVAGAKSSAEDDGPWPSGRTPSFDELEVDEDEVEAASGFGPAPSAFYHAPMYALRVVFALRDGQQKQELASTHLRNVERARDELLAQLAEQLRSRLSAEQRFSVLFSEMDRHEHNIAQKLRAFETADVEGAAELKDIETRLEAASAERMTKERERDQVKAVAELHEQEIKRKGAQLKRLDIDERHLDMRFEKNGMSEAQYYAALAQLKADFEKTQVALRGLEKEEALARSNLEQAEDAVRVAIAQYQKLEGTKEGLLMAFEGAITEHSQALADAKRARLSHLADAGRAILDLRGEISVDVEIRRRIWEADQAVRQAAFACETVRRALSSLDRGLYNLGLGIWVALLGGIFTTLLLFAVL